jgi:hypothetical protein
MGKAVIFSIVSLLIVILFVSSSSLITKFRIGESELEITRTRVKMLNSVVSDLENSYFERLLYISSKNALVGLTRYYSETDFDGTRMKKKLDMALNDVIYQGILYDARGKDIQANLTGYIDYNYTLKGLITNISAALDSLGLEVTELNVSIAPIGGIRQSDPWTIQVKGEFTYFISDKKGLASWKGFSSKTVNVSVIGLYLYDIQNGPWPTRVSNNEIVTSDWKLDNGTKTEVSAVAKLTGTDPDNTRGICKSYCQVN